jgi:site-specific DNA recombinase
MSAARAAPATALALRAVIYARASTEHQDESTDVQVLEATRYAEAQGWTVTSTYVDDALSRAEYKKRPELFAMLNAADRGDFDAIVLRDVDRLGGDTHRNGVILSDLLDRGVRIDEYLTRNTVRLDDAISKFMATAKNFAAEIEREKTSARTREALKVKAERGLNVGGRVFGYDNHRKYEGEKHIRTEYAVNEEQAETVREIYRLFRTGLGHRSIAKELNARGVPPPHAGRRGTGSWCPSSVFVILRNERYRGVISYGRMRKGYRSGTKVRTKRELNDVLRIERPELRIVPEELWLAVQAQRRKVAAKPWDQARGSKPKHLLSGLAVCAVCGGGIKAGSRKHGTALRSVYLCGYHHDRGVAVCGNAVARPIEEIDGRIIEWVQTNILQEGVVKRVIAEVRRRIEKQAKTHGGDVDRLDAQIAKLRKEVRNLSEAIAMANVSLPSLVERLSERQAELSKLEVQATAKRTAPSVLSLECRRLERDIVARIDDLRGVLARNPRRAREALQALLVDKLTFRPMETTAGKRYEITGRLVVGGLLHLPADDSRMVASPGGFEPPLAT